MCRSASSLQAEAINNIKHNFILTKTERKAYYFVLFNPSAACYDIYKEGEQYEYKALLSKDA